MHAKSASFRHAAHRRRTTIVAVNKPVGENARTVQSKKRTQLKTKVMGKATWTKRDKTSGEFTAVRSQQKTRAFIGRKSAVIR
jgi:hypothetical protein